jgi:hypothetical protein
MATFLVNEHSKPWTVEDTRLWIHEVSLKLEAYDHYLHEMTVWCEENDITSEHTIMVLSFLTILWVGYQNGEPVSKQQAFELVGAENWEKIEDRLYALPAKYGELSHTALLELAASQNYDNDF